MDGIVEALRRSSLLADLPDATLEGLVDGARPVTVATGEILIAEGDKADAAYVLLEGELEVTKRVGDAELPLNRCLPGDPVGELGLVDRRPRSATVRALRDSRLLRIGAEEFRSLLTAPAVAERLVSSTARRLEQREAVMRQHARMATLGSLTAGLLHELGNPAAALRRTGEQLTTATAQWAAAADELDGRVLAAVRAAGSIRPRARLQGLERVDEEERLRARLESTGIAAAGGLAARLAGVGVSDGELAALAGELSAGELEPAARALAARLEVPELTATIREAAARITEVADAVKAYAHHDRAPVGQVSIHEGLERALTLLRHRQRRGVVVARQYAADMPMIEGYPGELNSVWTNLIENALDAVGEVGHVTLCTRANSDHVTVNVIDDGPGIPEHIRERVFDPFFTTKPVGSGTGLGLAVAHTIVTQRHGGRLEFSSRPGRTDFTVWLPRRLGAHPA